MEISNISTVLLLFASWVAEMAHFARVRRLAESKLSLQPAQLFWPNGPYRNFGQMSIEALRADEKIWFVSLSNSLHCSLSPQLFLAQWELIENGTSWRSLNALGGNKATSVPKNSIFNYTFMIITNSITYGYFIVFLIFWRLYIYFKPVVRLESLIRARFCYFCPAIKSLY
jgi:hypothetical protein